MVQESVLLLCTGKWVQISNPVHQYDSFTKGSLDRGSHRAALVFDLDLRSRGFQVVLNILPVLGRQVCCSFDIRVGA